MSVKNMYREMILEHNKNPRNFGVLEEPTHVSHGKNPLCGDDYYIFLKISVKNILEDISFHGHGCAISKSSASMLTQKLKGKKIDDTIEIKDAFLQLLTEESFNDDLRSLLGHLDIFEGVKEFPVRVKCATLIWRSFEAALKSDSAIAIDITTEE